jgi:hypothetical protein
MHIDCKYPESSVTGRKSAVGNCVIPVNVEALSAYLFLMSSYFLTYRSDIDIHILEP